MCEIKKIKNSKFDVCLTHNELVNKGERGCFMQGFVRKSLMEMMQDGIVTIEAGEVSKVCTFVKHRETVSGYRSYKEYTVQDYYVPVDGWETLSILDLTTVHLWEIKEVRCLVDEGAV